MGCGKKTATILDALVKDERPLRVIITDSIKEMLRVAYKEITSRVRPNIEAVIPVRVDIAKSLEELRRAEDAYPQLAIRGRTSFFELGCTLANAPENWPLRVLSSTLIKGDILVLGLEFHRLVDGREATPDHMLAPYKNAPSFEAYWDAQYDRGHRTYDIWLEKSGTNSNIPGSLSVLASLPGLASPFMVSNRYDEAEFLAFVSRFRFRHLFSRASPRNPFYQHVVLERI